MTSSDVQSEDDQGGEMEGEEDPQNWQSLVSHDVLASLTPQEIKRQEIINGEATPPHDVPGAVKVHPAFSLTCVCGVCVGVSELFYTERSHLRKLKVLDAVFYQRMNRDGILPPEDIKNIFVNLEEIIQLHGKHDSLLSARRDGSGCSRRCHNVNHNGF